MLIAPIPFERAIVPAKCGIRSVDRAARLPVAVVSPPSALAPCQRFRYKPTPVAVRRRQLARAIRQIASRRTAPLV